MDRIGIEILRREMAEDCAVISDAAAVAREHLTTGGRAGLEAAAFQLARCYNTVELLAQRVARAFENHIDPADGWHVEILRRLALNLPGIRPPLFPADLLPALQNLRAFRHVVRHAYDLEISAENLEQVISRAEEVASRIEACCSDFCDQAAAALR